MGPGPGLGERESGAGARRGAAQENPLLGRPSTAEHHDLRCRSGSCATGAACTMAASAGFGEPIERSPDLCVEVPSLAGVAVEHRGTGGCGHLAIPSTQRTETEENE